MSKRTRKTVAQISETKVDELVEEVEHVCKCPACQPEETQKRGTKSSAPAHMCQMCYREPCVEYAS